MPVNNRRSSNQLIPIVVVVVMVVVVVALVINYVTPGTSDTTPTTVSTATQPTGTATASPEPMSPAAVSADSTSVPNTPTSTLFTVAIAVPLMYTSSLDTASPGYFLRIQTGGVANSVQLAIEDAKKAKLIPPHINVIMKTFDEGSRDGDSLEELSKKAKDTAGDISEDDDVQCVVGHYTSRSTEAAAPIYRDNLNQPLAAITSTSSWSGLTPKPGNIETNTLWRLVTTDENQGFVGAQLAIQQLGKTDAFIITGSDRNQIEASKDFGSEFAKQRRQVISTTLTITQSISNTQEVIEQLGQWQNKGGPESKVIYVAMTAPDAATLFDAMKDKISTEIPVIGIDTLDRTAIVQPRDFPLYITTMALPPGVDRWSEFADKYKKAQGNQFAPPSYAAESYDAALLCLLAISKASEDGSNPSPEEVLKQLRALTFAGKDVELVEELEFFASDRYLFWAPGIGGTRDVGELHDFNLYTKKLITNLGVTDLVPVYKWERDQNTNEGRKWVSITPSN